MRTLFLMGLLVFASSLMATSLLETKELKGQIVDAKTEQALEFATISVYDPTNQLVDGTITDISGRFSIELAPNSYRIVFEFIGYGSKEQTIDLTKNLDLGIISLEANSINLDAVDVRAEKSQLELKLDKKVFNVGKDLTAQGGSANEVLNNVPSVEVDIDGNVSLRGNGSVVVLINGRPSALADNNALESIPASSIEKVEVITNPSARYESAGTGGIINLVLKEDKQKGRGGSLSISVGNPAEYQAMASFYFRQKRFNLFGNLGFRYSNYFSSGESTRRTVFPDGSTELLFRPFDMERNDRAGNGFIGFDYELSKNSTLTASYSNYTVTNTDRTITDSDFRNGEMALERQWQQVLDYVEPEAYHQIEVAYTRNFEQKGRKLTVFFQNDFWDNDERETRVIEEFFPLSEEFFRLRTRDIEYSNDYLLQADYNTPIGEFGKFEAGLRGETRVITSDYIAETFEDNGWQVFEDLDNVLDYYERIGGAYIQYGQEREKFSYLLGLRNEYTYVSVENKAEETDITKIYNRLFPTVNLSYRFDDRTSLGLNYSKRIRRPSFWQLNPFGGLASPNEVFRGNSDMDPAYTDRAELTFLKRWDKWSINPSIYASSTQDFFGTYITQEADGLVVRSPLNLSEEQALGLELITNFEPFKGWQISSEFNFFAFRQEGQFQEVDFGVSNDSWRTSLRIRGRLPADFTVQANFRYNAAIQTAQTIEKDVLFADFAVAKNFMGDRLTATLNIRNAFESQIYQSVTSTPSFSQSNSRDWIGRRFRLTIAYRLQEAEMENRRPRGSIR